MRHKNKKNLTKKEDVLELYDPMFHDHRFEIIEKNLSPETLKKFKKLSNEDKAMFIVVLIEEGVLSW